jgi:hypothetical protein
MLGVSHSTIARWQLNCGPLEGDSLTPVSDWSLVTGMPLKTWSLSEAERILAAFQAAKKGVYKDRHGIVRLSLKRALKQWRRVRKSVCDRTFFEWCETGCVHLPGRRKPDTRLLNLDGGPTAASHWIAKQDVDDIRQSFADLKKDRYFGESRKEPCLTARGAARHLRVTIKTIYDREAAGKIDSLPFRSKRGSGAGETTRAFSLSTLDKAMRHKGFRFDGVFDRDDRDKCRLTIKVAAKVLGVTRHAVGEFIKKGLLTAEDKCPPHSGRPLKTVSQQQAFELKAERQKAIRRRRPEGWGTASEVFKLHGISAMGDWMNAYRVLVQFRKEYPDHARRFHNGRNDQCQLVWNYHLAELARSLRGRSLLKVAEALAGAEEESAAAGSVVPGASLKVETAESRTRDTESPRPRVLDHEGFPAHVTGFTKDARKELLDVLTEHGAKQQRNQRDLDSLKLTDTERIVVKELIEAGATPEKGVLGEDLARRLNYPYDGNFRELLSQLKKREIIGNLNQGKGYYSLVK